MNYIQTIRQKVGHDEILCVGAGIWVYNRNGQLLLQKRKDNGCWGMHGGCVELGEEVEAAARRELREETGLIAGPLELLGVFSGEDMRHTYPNGDKVSIVGIHYLCRDFSGSLSPQAEEVSQLRWFPLDSLPAPITPPDRRSLSALLRLLQAEG